MPQDLTKNERLSLLQNFTIVTVTFSSTFTAASTFFTSIMISKYSAYNPSINIPTLFLVISTFGFLYSTMIYSLNAGHLLNERFDKFIEARKLGGILSEYFGIYFLLLAIPLIINVISNDLFLRMATSLADLGGLLLYHLSGFSIMERNFRHYHSIYIAIIVVLEIILIYFQFSNTTIFELTAGLLTGFIVVIAISAQKNWWS